MNKAFVREPDDLGGAQCPRCGSLGIAVAGETLDAQLAPAERRNLPESAYYCPFARCEVGYFDQFDRWVASDKLLHPAYPKDPAAPLCPCFDFSCEEVEADVREGGTRRVKELLARTKSSSARCTTMSPSGQGCMGELQRYYMRLREQTG
ncbi:MAG TPA: hypothetical protein VG125_15900 [Pirellulales bacterium]|jgi:hypothetical protein|nr:hypothetical protein [Pirellulales bacterium]